MSKRCFGLLKVALILVLLCGRFSLVCPAAVKYPGPEPGSAHSVIEGPNLYLSNRVLSVSWRMSDQGLQDLHGTDRQSGHELVITNDVFQVLLADGMRYRSSALRLQGAPVEGELVVRSDSSRMAGRIPGRKIETAWVTSDGRLRVVWRALLHDGATYIRQEVDLVPTKQDMDIREIGWLDRTIDRAVGAGSVDGSPVVADSFFFGCEDPMAINRVKVSERKVGSWSPADFKAGPRRTKRWQIHAAWLKKGTNTILFRYERGPHRLDIWNLSLVEDGREVARDVHHGHTGISHVDNIYRLSVPRLNPLAKYELVAELTTDPDFKLPAGGSVESWGNAYLLGGHETVTCRLPRNAILPRGEALTLSFVMGVAPSGQMRRAFLHYLERERAHPYRPFLHYNSWYDTAWSPFNLNETNCLEAIRITGERFIKPHDVVMDAMVFDDGWDNPKSLWQFHDGFPNGFTPLAELCRQYKTRLGVWLSPFGGYGEPKRQRLKFGREQGYETNPTGFSMAGPKYYAAFKDSCVNMIKKYGVNHFKFDGIAAGMYASGGAGYVLDTEAMRRLMLELREVDADVYINLTTGSWPSPFWLRYADSVWRQGGDMGWAGKGPRQQQWLTYRDQETYRNIVGKGPLYPLNSLMTQGVAYSRRGTAGEPTFNSAGFKDDVRAFFGSGTGLQELYIQPDKLTKQDWQVLAEAARWSRANADVLVDTHWIGGDPSRLEIYGFASWSPRKGIFMLRNPDDQPKDYSLEVKKAFELPPGAPGRYKVRSPWREDSQLPVKQARAGDPLVLRLRPFEVLICEAIPE